jgi:hypothetical protein
VAASRRLRAASLQACKAILRHWRREIIAGSFRELKEFIGHDGAHGMDSNIVTANFTAASSVKTCHGRIAACA